MRVVIVGNGIAGIMGSKFLRDMGSDADIDVYSDERFHYYPRPNLIEHLAGNLSYERLFAFSEDWYDNQRIRVFLGRSVRAIRPQSRQVEVEGGGKEKYDFLLLTNGSAAFIPPLRGADKSGVFTMRTLDDCLAVADRIRHRPHVTVLGGGLLGLEIARAAKSSSTRVRVVEFFDRLLPRQLDPPAAALLKDQIEKMGIEVHLGLACEEILGEDEVKGLRFKGGREMEAETVVIAAGVRPQVGLAQQAGLETDKGIVVDDKLRTSDPRIFAAGDNIQHRGRSYGIIPACFEQARVAAGNILGQEQSYQGTIPANTLKVVGLYVTSVGLVNPGEEPVEEIKKHDPEKGVYKKIVVREDVVLGAIWMGTKTGAADISRVINQKIPVGRWRGSLVEDDFDFSVL